MDDDYRELANRLFATATAMLEDVIEVAAAHEIAIIAEAAVIVANPGVDRRRVRRERSR